MSPQTLSLIRELIVIESTQYNQPALEAALGLALSYLPEYTVEHFKQGGAVSALVYNAKKRPKKFKVILNGHLDVVPATANQYSPQIRQHKLYGAGAMDMKASVACLITVFKEVANKVDYPLGLQLVTDEEIGGFNGTKHQIDQGVSADFVIAGEATSLNIANKTKGVLWLKITAKGKTAHGAYPWKGENAIWKMQEFLELLHKHYPTPATEQWQTTINLSRLETSNRSYNKIPDDCEAWLDVRYIAEESGAILGNIKKLLPVGFKLEIIVNEPAQFVDKGNPYIKLLQQATQQTISKSATLYGANGSSDARHFTRTHCDGVEFGPIGGGIGSDKEWVDLRSLEHYQQILKTFLSAL
jgi:succinyl-diaminopimelate desuccinylase